MTQLDFVLPPGSWVLVTGANGYIATHIVDVLLSLGYNVRGTVRSPKPWLDAYFAAKHSTAKFQSFIVPELEPPGALDEAMKGVDGVLHTATDMSGLYDPSANVIANVTAATVNALESARRQPSIKRFVLTSSILAAHYSKANVEGIVTDGDSWNDAAIAAASDDALPPLQKMNSIYAASKTEGERVAWAWVEKNKPGFVFNTILPGLTVGEILRPEIPGSTMGLVRNLLQGDLTAIHFLGPPQWYVGVVDVARLHVIALLASAVHSERVFATARTHNWTDVLTIFRELRPLNTTIPPSPENEGRDLSQIPPSQRAEGLLKAFFGVGWTPLRDDLILGIKDLE